MNTFLLETDEALKLEFWQLENEANVRKEAQEKARKEQERLIMEGKLSEAAATASLIPKATIKVTDELTSYITETLKPSKGRKKNTVPVCKVLSLFSQADLTNIVGDSIALCLDGIGITPENSLIHAIGEHIEHAYQLKSFREQDKKAAKYLKDHLDQSAQTASQRVKSIEYSLAANRLEWKPWDKRKVVLLGQVVFFHIMEHGDLFELQPVVEVF